MKLLKGRELVGYIKERQAKQVRSLTNGNKVTPKLVILYDQDDPVILTYTGLKQKYGADIGIEVETVKSDNLAADIKKYNQDASVHGMIVQLPIRSSDNVEEILNQVSLDKDVDGLAEGSEFDPATPQAILWLLAGYNIELFDKKVHVIGAGRLVGAPLLKMLEASNVQAQVHTSRSGPIDLTDADVVITATGKPGLLTEDMIPENCVVVDAGTSSDKNKTVGDLAENVYEREDLTITPKRGGVGPLTVCALFENVIIATQNQTK